MKSLNLVIGLLICTFLLNPVIGMFRAFATSDPIANVSVLPLNLVVSVGQEFTVDVNMTDVQNLAGYECALWYDRNIVNATSAVRPAGHFMEPIDPSNLFVSRWVILNDFNETHGLVWLVLVLFHPELARNGSGVLARITFEGLNAGYTSIVLWHYGGPGRSNYSLPLKLATFEGNPIPHTATDGSVRVILPNSSIGDVNFDGKCDLFDIVMIASFFGANPNSTNWNPIVDINEDKVVDVFDLVSVLLYFDSSSPT